MAEIKEYPKDRIVMLEVSEDELDKLLEIAAFHRFSLNETILTCFQVGIIKILAKTMRDKAGI